MRQELGMVVLHASPLPFLLAELLWSLDGEESKYKPRGHGTGLGSSSESHLLGLGGVLSPPHCSFKGRSQGSEAPPIDIPGAYSRAPPALLASIIISCVNELDLVLLEAFSSSLGHQFPFRPVA